jgi:hypothetical protein
VKLEFLDISLSNWSMIIFLMQALLYTFITLVMFAPESGRSLYVFVILTFIINQVLFVLYGISTNQIGFILIVVFQFFLVLFIQMSLNSNIKNSMEEDYEDN